MAQPSGPRDEEEALRRAEFILFLRQRGIRDRRVMRAIESIPRTAFVSPDLSRHAYSDQALPIACGQTISQPYLVAYMTETLDLGERHKVLEVGTGSGYQAAVLSRLSRRVYTLDRYRTLVQAAETRFAALGITNITSMIADGHLGWPAQAPFDRILVAAAAPQIPGPLVDQLREGGIMLIPVGPQGGTQRLVRVDRTDAGITERDLMAVRFVPLVPGRAASM
jgi:protein-L-isoaspartate(D-aspartate) O-methyltransferase